LLGITALSQSPISSLGGTNVNVSVTGIDLTTSLGIETIQANANVILTGIPLTSTVDDVTIDLNTQVNLTGEDLTINLGDENAVTDVAVEVTGEQLDWTIGTYSISADGNQSIIAGPEQELETDLGSLTLTGTANVPVTGVSASITLGDESAFTDVDVAVTGQNIGTVEVNSVEIDLNTPVDLTGQQLTVALNNPLITAWSNVDPGVNNTWTEVNTSDTAVWVEVDLAA
jgi:hypothetical protein